MLYGALFPFRDSLRHSVVGAALISFDSLRATWRRKLLISRDSCDNAHDHSPDFAIAIAVRILVVSFALDLSACPVFSPSDYSNGERYNTANVMRL